MEKFRQGIEESLNVIKKKLIKGNITDIEYRDLSIKISQLQVIATEKLVVTDELLKEIKNTKQIIDRKEMK
jgi:hypothetical protein